MNPNKAVWEKGDFTRIAKTMRESGEALVQQLGIANGLKVLDLGCGDVTTAVPAANVGEGLAARVEDRGSRREWQR
jgi:cyclopropane fatty-acyl-phospholipid synthase-like methyltransferase